MAKPAYTIEVVARAVVRNGPRVLLAQLVGYDYWFLPGGHVEIGESAKTTIHRELEAELGLDVTVIDLVAVAENQYTLDDEVRHELNLVFLARVGAIPPHSRDPRMTFQWFDADSIGNLDIRPDSLASIVRYGPSASTLPLKSNGL